LIHFAVFQFISAALQNQYIGKVPEDGGKCSFTFKDKDGQHKNKLKVNSVVPLNNTYF
jgi:hypothetical protein